MTCILKDLGSNYKSVNIGLVLMMHPIKLDTGTIHTEMHHEDDNRYSAGLKFEEEYYIFDYAWLRWMQNR